MTTLYQSAPPPTNEAVAAHFAKKLRHIDPPWPSLAYFATRNPAFTTRLQFFVDNSPACQTSAQAKSVFAEAHHRRV
jgi:hypothetical protein